MTTNTDKAREAFEEWFYRNNGVYLKDAHHVFTEESLVIRAGNYMAGYQAATQANKEVLRANNALVSALTPSAETKYLHTGEYKFYINDHQEVTVPWVTVKEIMHAISKQAKQLIGDE